MLSKQWEIRQHNTLHTMICYGITFSYPYRPSLFMYVKHEPLAISYCIRLPNHLHRNITTLYRRPFTDTNANEGM